MALELDCKIISKLAPQSGQSARGPWSKQDFVVEYQDGQYTEKALLQAWGADRVKDLENCQVGDKIRASLKIQAREYNGRWYNDIRVWRIARLDGEQNDGYTSSFGTYAPAQNPAAESSPTDTYTAFGASTAAGTQTESEPESGDDLPF